MTARETPDVSWAFLFGTPLPQWLARGTGSRGTCQSGSVEPWRFFNPDDPCGHKERIRKMPHTTLAPHRRDSALEFGGSQTVDRPESEGRHKAVESDADHKLIAAVDRALRATGHPALRDLDIEICRGIVVLWGRVTTYHQKQLAQATAQKVEGVRGIANGLEVDCCRRRTTRNESI